MRVATSVLRHALISLPSEGMLLAQAQTCHISSQCDVGLLCVLFHRSITDPLVTLKYKPCLCIRSCAEISYLGEKWWHVSLLELQNALT